MISYAAFYDELEKIAKSEDRRVDKEMLKRHLKTVAATGVGAGAGALTGHAISRWFKQPRIAKRVPKSALPIALAVLGGAAGLTTSRHRRRVDQYLKEGK
jgi:hypothetical protein